MVEDVPDREDLVRRWRALGLNRNRIARDLGMTWRTVRNVETGERASNKQTLRAIDVYLRKLETG